MQTQRPHGIDFTRNVRHNDQDNVSEQQVQIVQINVSSFQTSIAWSESLRSDHSGDSEVAAVAVFFDGDPRSSLALRFPLLTELEQT